MQNYILRKTKKRIIASFLAATMILSSIPWGGIFVQAKEAEQIEEMTPEPMSLLAAGWGKDCEGSFSDWTVTGADYAINEDGSLTFTMNGSEENEKDHHPQMVNMNLSIDALKYEAIEVTYSNTTGNTGAQLYFLEVKDVDGGFQPGDRAFGETIDGNTEESKTLTFSVGERQSWTGTIGALRFNPVNTDETSGLSGSVTIYSIRLVEKENQKEPNLNPTPQTSAGWGKDCEGSFSDWTVTGADSAINEDGSLTFTMNGSEENEKDHHPQMVNMNLSIDASKYEAIEVTYSNTTGNTGAQLYFLEVKDVDGGFQPGDRAFGETIDGNTEEPKTLTFSVGERQSWTGTIGALRFNPVNTDETSGLSGSVTIYSIRLVEKEDQKEPNLNPTPQTSAGWGKDCEGSFSDWTVTGADYAINEDGSLTFTMNGSEENEKDHHPQMVNMNLSIDASKYEAIEVTYSNTTGNTGAQLYFLEVKDVDGGFQPGDRAFGGTIDGNTEESKTLTFSVGERQSWTGTIGALRFNPVNTDETSGLSGSVTIYSIRLVEKEDQGNSVPQTVTSWGVGKEGSLKDWKVSDAIATYSQDGSAVLTITGPDTQIKKEDLNIKAEDYQTLILTYVNHTKCKIGEAFFITDQQTVSGFQGNCNVGFIVEEGQNTVYIPFGEHSKWLGNVTGLRIDPVKDLTAGTFEIISMEFSDQKAPEQELAYEWDWDTDGDFEGWTLNSVIKNGKVEDSYLILPIEGEDPNISSPLMNLNAKLYPTVEISYKNETDNQYTEIFWNNGNGITQSYSTSFTAKNDGEWHTVRINLSSLEKWTGKITGLRIDPIRSGTGTFTIDAIRFLKTSVCDGAIATEWEWRTDANAEGWSAQRSSVSIKDGRAILSLNGQNDPIFSKEKEISIDTANYRTLEIIYKNNTDRTDAQFYWGDEEGNWVAADGVHVKNFTTQNDGQWHTLRVSLEEAENWTGIATKLRIDPTGDGGTGTFEIDKIALLYDGTGEYSRYDLSNGYFSISGAKGMIDKIAFDPNGNGNYSEDLVNGLTYMKLDANDVPYDAYSDEAVGSVSGNTLTISNIKFGTPEMIGTWTITLDGAKMTNNFELDTQGKAVTLKNCGFVMDILWENNTDEIEGEKNAPGSLKVPFLKTASASDRYHHVYAYKYMPSEEDVSTLGLEGEWMDWQGTNGFSFNLRFEADTEYMSALCYVDSMRYLFREPDKEKVSLDGGETFTRTLDITISESKDITPEHFAAYEASGENKLVTDGLNDIMWELGYSREPASTQSDWWEWVSLTRAWRNDNYLQPDLDMVTNAKQITESTYEPGDPGVGYIYTWSGSKGWPFPDDKDSNHYLTSTANYINAIYNYYTYNGDEKFLNENIEKMRLGMTYLLNQFSKREGVFIIDHKDHNGISDLRNNINQIQMKNNSVGSNYWDVTPYGFLSAYDNIYCYIALLRMAEIEQKLGNTERADELNICAETVKENYNKLFWKEDHYIQVIDSNRTEHDYGAVYLNLEALNYGLASEEQAKKMMNYLSTTVTDSGEADVFSRYAFAPRVTMKDNQYWYVYQYGNPGEYGVKQLQNGGANMYTMYYELMSWIKTGNSDKAYERIEKMVEFFYENRHLQGNADIEGVGKAQHFGEGIVGIWGEFPESGLVPVAVKDGFMGISADVNALNITPSMPSQMPEVSLDGIDYNGLGLKITTSNTSVTIEAQSNQSNCRWMINGEIVETDQNGLFTKVVSIGKGDTVVLQKAVPTNGEITPSDPKDDNSETRPESPNTGTSKGDADKKIEKTEVLDQQKIETNVKKDLQGNRKTDTGDAFGGRIPAMILLMSVSAGAGILIRRKKV